MKPKPMELTLRGQRLFAPGDRVRFVGEKDMPLLVTGTSVFGKSGHVKYDVTWVHNGDRKEACVQENEVEADK